MAAGVLDEALRRDAARSVGRDDLLLDVAAPEAYADVEALSRSAPAGEVQSPLTVPLIEWFVDRNPFGQGFVVVARDPETGAMVGHFVFYPWPLATRAGPGAEAEALPAFLFVRLYVAPAFRRRGVFAAMTRYGLEIVARLGVGLAYTAPNPKSSAGFVKFGMVRRGPLPVWLRPATALWDWTGGPGPARVDVTRLARFESEFAVPVGDALPPATTVWTPRDAARLNWRYAERPDADYDIRALRQDGRFAGYLVTRVMSIGGRSVLVVCDAWTAPGRAGTIRAGLRAALAGAGAPRLALAIGGGASPELARAYRRAGFVRCPTALLPQPVVLFGTPVGHTHPAAVPELGSWHVTPVDWDVF